jgi:hypothetical protein
LLRAFFRAHALPPDISATDTEHSSAQSKSSAMQRAIILTSGSCRHIDAQCWHATLHALHAAMHSR